MSSIECRTCGEYFNPNQPYHAEVGYVNQCGDCGREAGDDNIKVKAFTGFNNDGDWQGIEIVTADKYKEYEKAVEQYSDDA